MPTPDKKQEILKAASDCFAHYGYDKTTLDDIGRMVGLNKASLYHYYKNKESIFTEVIFFEAEEFICKVIKEVEKVEGCEEKILSYLTKRLDYIRSTVNLHKLTLGSVNTVKPLIDELYERIMDKEADYLSQIMDACIKKGEIADCDTVKVTKSILTITEAIKNRTARNVDCNIISDVNYTGIVSEVVFTVSLILEGLKAR
ncbi:MAG TPA: TetR/AcrR family transcriptional regulator [Clostridia bacterium]|nr:TetR/AcrR family transcriptional regulator [Clostridia bacterium]